MALSFYYSESRKEKECLALSGRGVIVREDHQGPSLAFNHRPQAKNRRAIFFQKGKFPFALLKEGFGPLFLLPKIKAVHSFFWHCRIRYAIITCDPAGMWKTDIAAHRECNLFCSENGNFAICVCIFPNCVISTKAKPHGEILRDAETGKKMGYRSLHFISRCVLTCHLMAGGQDLSTSSR